MSFDHIAEFYPLLFDESARLDNEKFLLLELLQRYKSPVRVLDLACGSGVHARFFAEYGCHVTAVDLSPAMLRYARAQKLSEKIDYVVADMVKLPFTGLWDVIVCLGNSLCLIPHRHLVHAFFSQIQSLLAPEGVFVMQILNYNHPGMQEIQTKCVRKEAGDKKVTIIKTLTPEKEVVFLSIAYFAYIEGAYKTSSETNILQKWTLTDLSRIATDTNLVIQSVYGDYQKSPFDLNTSKDLIILISKQ